MIINDNRLSTNDPFDGMNVGDRARDVLSGIEGIVTGRAQYLTGCHQLCILPRSDDGKKLNEAHWFDVERCELIESGVVTIRPNPKGMDMPFPKAK